LKRCAIAYDYLIAQELKNNSKWIINGEGTPIVDLQ
jgi:hypothetical protein